VQLNKNIKIFINYFLGPVLFIWLSISIYHQIQSQKQLVSSWLFIRQNFGSVKMFLLAGAMVLIPVNWGLEAFKWKLSIAHLQYVSFKNSFRAVLSGLSFSVTIPNRIGEYLGRIFYLQHGQRLKAVSATIISSFSQLLITLIAGIAGLLLIKNLMVGVLMSALVFRFIIYGLTGTTLVLLLLYFNIAGSAGLFKRWIKNQKYIYLVDALAYFNYSLLVKMLIISLIRYIVFLIQYFLVFHFFEVNLSAIIISEAMSVVFLFMAIVPSIALIEIGLRGEACIKIIGLFSGNALGISLTSVTIWLLNLILPAIAGSLFLLNLKVFKRNNEII
jgi:hypothetical protein